MTVAAPGTEDTDSGGGTIRTAEAAVSVPEVPGLKDRLSVFDAGSVRISATELRNALAAGRSIEGRVPGPVAEYITKHGLYNPGMPNR